MPATPKSPEARARYGAWMNNPVSRAKWEERMRVVRNSPEWRNACNHLSPEQRALIAGEIKDCADTYYDIAERWMITAGHVRAIAKAFGVGRKPRGMNEKNIIHLESLASRLGEQDAAAIMWAIGKIKDRLMPKRKT